MTDAHIRKNSIASPLRLMWIWTLAGLAFFVGPYFYFFAPAGDGHDRQGYLLGRDFVNVWFGAQQAIAGKGARILQHKEYLSDMRDLLGAGYPRHNFSYPPHILPLILAFGILTYFPSLALWTVAGGAAYVLALKANPYYKFTTPGLLLTLLSPACLFNFMFGQNGAFTGALLLGGLYLCEASPALAGVLFGLLTVKPHLGLLVPLVLLMRRNWICIASAGITTLALIGVSTLFWGVGPWHDYVYDTLPYQEAFLNGPGNIFNPLMPGPWSDAVRMLPLSDWRLPLYGICAAVAFASVVITVRKEGITARSTLLIALATLVILPYGFNYDMPAIAGALAVYLGTLETVGIGEFILMGMLWALPLALVLFKVWPVPFSSAILMSSLICLHFSRACGKPQTR